MKRPDHSLEEPFPNKRRRGDAVDCDPYPDIIYLESDHEDEPVFDPYPDIIYLPDDDEDVEPEEVTGEYPGWGTRFDWLLGGDRDSHPPWIPNFCRPSLPTPQFVDDQNCGGEWLRLPAAEFGKDAEPSSRPTTVSFYGTSPLQVVNGQDYGIDGAYPTTLLGEDRGWSLLELLDEFDCKFLSQQIAPETESDANNNGSDLAASAAVPEFARFYFSYTGNVNALHCRKTFSIGSGSHASTLPVTEPWGIEVVEDNFS